MNLLGQIDDLVSAEMERWEVPGLSIGFWLDGVQETAGFGVANLSTGERTRPETLFQIGSISKVFTTTLLMTLVDEGVIDLDKPVVHYLPELRLSDEAAMGQITPRHLVTHMAGFYGDRFDDHGRGEDALARGVAAMRDLPQQTAPGELWTYCNAGFDIAGRMIEVVLGTGFEKAMRQRVFEPLGLDRVTYFPDEAIRHAVAAGHIIDKKEGWAVASPWPIPRRSNPAGGVSTNVSELLRFALMHLTSGALEGQSIISEDAAAAMRTVQVPADYNRLWGLGWQLREIDSVQIAEHGGATNGFMARLTIVPSRQFAMAVLTNNEYGSQAHGPLLAIALDRFLGLKSAPDSRRSLTAAELANVQGHYEHGLAKFEIASSEAGVVLKRKLLNPFSGEWTTRQPASVSRLEKDVLIVDEGDAKGATLEVIRHRNRDIRFIRTGGRLAYPVTSKR